MRILIILIYLGEAIISSCNQLCEDGIIMYSANRTMQYLTTPYYDDGFLPHNFTCSLVIQSDDSSRIWINIEELNMEFQVFDGCLDHITILNTSSKVSKKEDTLATLCGQVTNRPFVSNNDHMRLEIFTDMVISSRGARVAYRSLPNDECDDGWHEYQTKCFYLSPNALELKWVDAQKACVDQQANLASVAQWNAYQDALLWLEGLNVTSSIWLGLSDTLHEGFFSGPDGSHDFPFNWGSPNNFHNNDVSDCVYVNMSTTNITDGEMFQLSDCRERRMFLCEKNKIGITWTAPDQSEIVRAGAQTWNFDVVFWILFVITILLIILICTACILALKKRQRQSRVSAASDTAVRAPVNTRSTTHSDPRGNLQMEQENLRNAAKTEQNNKTVAVANAEPVNAVEPVEELQVELIPKRENSPPTKEVVKVEEIGKAIEVPRNMIYVQAKDNISKLSPNVSNMEGLQSRERTMITLHTRDESFMKSKKASEMFGRPKMNVLDNVSAISLDDFWSNQYNPEQIEKNK